MVTFSPTTECNGVYHDKNYRMVSCLDGNITFSYAAKGKAMSIHFASNKKGLRYVKLAINSFCQWLFDNYNCPMIFGAIDKDRKGIMRIVEKVGFSHIATNNEHCMYVRIKK